MAIMGDSSVVSNNLIIGELVQRELIAQSKLLSTIMNVSSFAKAGLESIQFPKAGNFNVVKKASLTPVTTQALTYTTDQLDLDQQAVVRWSVEWKAALQSEVAVLQDAIGRASRAHAKQVDVDIYDELIAGATDLGNSGAATFRREDIVTLLTALDNNDVPEEGRFLAINPTEKGAMLNISDFINAGDFGSDRVIQKGQIGEVFGVPVISSTVVLAGAPVMYHNEAAAIGFQKSPEFRQDQDMDNLADDYVLWQLYGLKSLLNSNAAITMTVAV